MIKIVSRVIGGLGNQLFSYAAARRLALVSGAELTLDHVSGFPRDAYERSYQLDHFSIPVRKATPLERLEPFGRVRRATLRRLSKNMPFEKRRYIFQEGVDFDARLLHLKVQGTLYLEGYWQSARYFADKGDVIREDLRIQPPKDATNMDFGEQIRATTAVAVHVRFFDEPSTGVTDNAPRDYYARAVSMMEALIPNAHYFVFSDRPEDARACIPLPKGRITLVSHNQGDENAYADLWLMSLCNHFIIANSTFSWWGAWLAKSRNKHVIAPGFEKRQGKMWWGFDGLLPDEWIKL